MKKLILGLIALVMCFSSFKGMAQESVEVSFVKMQKADLEFSKRLLKRVKNLNLEEKTMVLNEISELYNKIESDHSLFNDENFMNNLSIKTGFNNFIEYKNYWDIYLNATNIFLRISNYSNLSAVEQQKIIEDNTSKSSIEDLMFADNDTGGNDGICKDVIGFLNCSGICYAGVFTCKLACVTKHSANPFALMACAGMCEVSGAFCYVYCYNKYCK